MRKTILLLSGIFLLASTNLRSQNNLKNDSAKIDTVRIIIQHIFDIDFVKQEYKIEFWLKFTSEDSCSLVKLEEQLAVVHAKKTTIDTIPNWNQDNCSPPDSGRNNNHYFRKNLKVTCTMIQEWTLNRFPFDSQNLHIAFYNAARGKKWVKLLASRDVGYADTLSENEPKNSILVENGWVIENRTIGVDSSNAEFNDATLSTSNSRHSAAGFTLTLSREKVWGLYFKLLIGMYVAFSVAAVALFIDISETHASFDLPVGGLFAAIANKYIIETILPETPLFTLVDFLHAVTIVFIFSIISYKALILYQTKSRYEIEETENQGKSPELIRKERADSVRRSHKINRQISWSVIGLFVIINILAIILNHR
jgi:hypothetical protein